MVQIIDYFVSSHSLKEVSDVKRNGRVEYKVACIEQMSFPGRYFGLRSGDSCLYSAPAKARLGGVYWSLLVLFEHFDHECIDIDLHSTKHGIHNRY